MLECDRREWLKGSLAVAGAMLLPSLALAGQHRKRDTEARSLSFYHTHTGARGNFTYWEHGEYQQDALTEINRFLRDFRTRETHRIDQTLLDQLYLVHYFTDSSKPFQVISGYRSPKTNAMLARRNKGVDQNSFHMQGRAIDVRLGDVALDRLHKAALHLQAGGVGYYPRSNFIHLDSGPIRNWSFGV
jgi:uncharacterized protein YcbK (DUF882 family)